MRHFSYLKKLAVIAICMMAGNFFAMAAPSIEVTIQPSQISIGESAQLIVVVTGRGSVSIPLPVVPGLEFRTVGQSHQVQMINGVTTESTSTIVQVTPEEAGVFTIPSLTANSAPLVLRVNPGGGNGSSVPPNSATAPAMPPAASGNSNSIQLTSDGSAFVHLDLPKHEIYVGESIPLEIQVGVRDGLLASVNGLPKLDNDEFTLNNLSRQPERSTKIVDGKPFSVFTWHSLLTAVKPGSFSLKFETPLTIQVRTQSPRDSMLEDLLDDPTFQSFFGRTVSKNITVSNPQAAMSVLPLPTEGKPNDFNGAVGSFKITTDISSPTSTAGDPLTLRMHINGNGSFDRVQSNMLNGDPSWKTYEPKSVFNPADAVGYQGEKVFEQPLIATQPGAQTIPPLSFSFFDPTTRRYETAHSAPLNVEVSPSIAEKTTSASPPPSNAALAPQSNNESRNELRPDHATTDAHANSLVPLFFQPKFLGLCSILAVLFSGGWLMQRHRMRTAQDAQRRRDHSRLRIVNDLLKQMNAAAACNDTAAFLHAACGALRQILGARWQIAPEHVTLTVIDTRLEGSVKDDIHQIFVLSDEANYSGNNLTATDFEHWTQVVRHQSSAMNEKNS